MTSVDDCAPELPPELMISGMRRERIVVLASSCSKCVVATVVNISPTKSTASHTPRLRSMLKKLRM